MSPPAPELLDEHDHRLVYSATTRQFAAESLRPRSGDEHDGQPYDPDQGKKNARYVPYWA